MPNQTSYGSIQIGYAGQRVGRHHFARSYVNDTGAAAMVSDVVPAAFTLVAQVETYTAPGTPSTSGTYTITVNGQVASFTSSSSTQQQVRDGLVTALNALGQPVTVATVSTTGLTITVNVAGTPFTIAIGGTAVTVATIVHTTANYGTGTVYSFTLNGTTVSYTATRTDTIIIIRDALIAAARAIQLLEGVAYFNSNGNNVRVTASVPGTAFTATAVTNTSVSAVTANGTPLYIPFGVAIVKRTGAGTVDKSATTPTTTGQSFLGVSERIHTVCDPMQSAPNNQNIAPFADITVGYRGTWYVNVEVAVSAEDSAYFRTAANGALTTLGAWRNDSDSGNADALTQAKFKTSALAGGIAELEISIP